MQPKSQMTTMMNVLLSFGYPARRALLYTCLLVWLTGCATDHDATKPSSTTAGTTQIAQAAVATSQSLTLMAETEQAALTPKTPIVAPDPRSYGMGQIVSIDWSGPIEPLLSQIAHMTGYSLNVLGKKPAIPVLVDIYARNQQVGAILRNAAYQADKRANVLLYPRRKLIELRYVNA